MFKDLLIELVEAKTKEEKEKAYKHLEEVGVDRTTANYLCVKCGIWNKS